MNMTSTIDIDSLRINGERLWASLMELAQIGATSKGGVCRLTLTDLDKQGRDLVTRWARCSDTRPTQSLWSPPSPCSPHSPPAPVGAWRAEEGWWWW